MTSLFTNFTRFSHSFENPQITKLMEQGNLYVSQAVHLQFNLDVKPQAQVDFISHDVMHFLFGFKLPPNLLFEMLEDPGELAFTSHFAKTPF